MYPLPEVEYSDQNTEGGSVKGPRIRKEDLFCTLVKLYNHFGVDVKVLTRVWHSSWKEYWEGRPISDEINPKVKMEESMHQLACCCRALWNNLENKVR